MEKKEGQKTERTENKEETKDEKKEDKTKEQNQTTTKIIQIKVNQLKLKNMFS